MTIPKETKVQIFDLVTWYFLPLVFLYFAGQFGLALVETNWLPSQKESIPYLIAFYSLAVIRLLLGLFIFVLYMDQGDPPFNRRLRPEALLTGWAFGSALTGFFFLLTWLGPGFTVMQGQGYLFIWEVFLFRYLPLFMVYGVGLQILMQDKHSVWKQALLALILQTLWALMTQAWGWSQGSTFDATALYPLATVVLSIALMKKFGIYAAASALLVNALAYQIILLVGLFPLPSHLNSIATVIFMLVLIQVIHFFQYRPKLLAALHSQQSSA